MKKALVTIQGKKPLLFHKFNINVITDTKKPKEGSAGNSPSEWKDTVFCHGLDLYLPDAYFFSTFVGGGKYVKAGRGTIAKNLAGILEITKEKSFFENRKLPKVIEEIQFEDLGNDSSKEIYVDVRMVSNPNTKGKNVRYRLALGSGWIISTEIRWDDSVISKSQMQQAIESSGSFVGIADARAIGNGRFDLLNFQEII